MKVKLTTSSSSQRKKLLITIFNSFVIFCFLGAHATYARSVNKTVIITQQTQISGVIYDNNEMPLAGATVLEKGTSNGVQTDFDGKFSLNLSSSNATLVISYIGFVTKEIAVNNQSTMSITLDEDISQLDEVVVVGYGTQKKVNLTASVSQIGEEIFENRPVANTARSLQGAVSNLQITTNTDGGRPGSSPSINIRGFITSVGSGDGSIQNAGPLVLVDGIEMGLDQINPDDIESVSVLKDAAAASIYGSRAAAGAIIVITKSGKSSNGKMKVNYSNNFSFSSPTIWPESVDALTFAYVMNEARANINASPYWDEDALERIRQNMANPGSAPTMFDANNDGRYEVSSLGLGTTGSTDWKDFLFKDFAESQRHNLSFTGGDKKLNYYISTGLYNESGLLAVGDESFKRLTVDAKIGGKANDWLSFELLTKFLKSEDDFPWDARSSGSSGTSRVFDLLSKLKPTLPTVDPNGNPLIQAQYPYWANEREENENNQIAFLPRVIIEPAKDWIINLQYNYRRNNNKQVYRAATTTYLDAFEETVFYKSQEQTSYAPQLITNEYFSPNLFTTYTKSIGGHNFKALVGYQNELYEYYALNGGVSYLITDNVTSINTSLDDTPSVGENIFHWSTESVFSRFNYNYKEKYLFEFSYRRDGSSRFKPGDQWAGFPSYSVGYNVAKENFWPIKDISTFKPRGSYGTLGNQNVPNYNYISAISINSPGTQYLFDGNRALFSSTPGLSSENLTWETVQTTDIGIDINAFNNKLIIAFDWYRTDIEGMAGPGQDLPTVLGTTSPLTNIGTSRVQGWEFEGTWRQNIGDDFSYNIRAVLSDYKRSIVSYPNEANLLSDYYAGQDLGEIWGLQWDGWFQTQEEVDNRIDQSFVAGNFTIGDTKYKDINGDDVIDRGTNTLGDSGDFTVIGNTTPRYQYSATIGFNYKNLDFNMFIQGVGKRDILVSNHQRFRGPAQGPLHAMVFEEHLDYYRPEDTTNPLGPNTDAYFPKPYAANPGNNNRNYRYNVDRYIQNGAYTRIKNIQVGYTIPKKITDKYSIDKIRLFVTGENLFTSSNNMFYDPETVPSGFGSAQSYPLSKVFSTGVNVSF
ncbi:SusC/RagA family TonB-linked outer membrane protein [Neotamlana sedimentorum]|uniref:SusC/RagA family TonB-linked outer membrane protein n=1 Tax=Neotamlana sedimentorum TaxID=1435349 RepID=UPI000A584005|nr:TonB-dependent receptor [Tamlana sedimentorum]